MTLDAEAEAWKGVTSEDLHGETVRYPVTDLKDWEEE